MKQSELKISTEPHEEPVMVREYFLRRLNYYSLKGSFGKRGLVLDKDTKEAVELICQYANNESKFEKKDSYSLKKGLLLAGNCGSGKTQMMESYRDLRKRLGFKIGIVTCKDMNSLFEKFDPDLNAKLRYTMIDKYANKLDPREMIFDDLGAENPVIKDYGNDVCIMDYIFSERHKGIRDGLGKTHTTTNLTKEQRIKYYGGRIDSRASQMFNVIHLGASKDWTDYRKL